MVSVYVWGCNIRYKFLGNQLHNKFCRFLKEKSCSFSNLAVLNSRPRHPFATSRQISSEVQFQLEGRPTWFEISIRKFKLRLANDDAFAQSTETESQLNPRETRLIHSHVNTSPKLYHKLAAYLLQYYVLLCSTGLHYYCAYWISWVLILLL